MIKKLDARITALFVIVLLTLNCNGLLWLAYYEIDLWAKLKPLGLGVFFLALILVLISLLKEPRDG